MSERGKRVRYETVREALIARGGSSSDTTTVERVIACLALKVGAPREVYRAQGDLRVVDIYFGTHANVGLYAAPNYIDVTPVVLNEIGGVTGLAQLYPGFERGTGTRTKMARLPLSGYRGSRSP